MVVIKLWFLILFQYSASFSQLEFSRLKLEIFWHLTPHLLSTPWCFKGKWKRLGEFLEEVKVIKIKFWLINTYFIFKIQNISKLLKACYFKKVGLVDLSPYGGKIKFEFWLSRQRRAGRQNSNFIFPPSEPKSTRPTFIKW